jgi:hypothetical protein
MRKGSGKWGRRLLWLLPTILALYLLVKLADFAWFRTHIPVGFLSANWSGKWETQYYWSLSGRLLVHLPDPLPENQPFNAEAVVYYPIYSGWKTGQFVKMDFQGLFNPESPASAGRTTNPVPGGGGGKLKFKGTVGNQVVEYVALIDESHTRIVGGYLSKSPNDFGYFSITNP